MKYNSNYYLSKIFSSVSNHILNGCSQNKIYYLLPISIFYQYKFSLKEIKVLKKFDIDIERVHGYKATYCLLKIINNKLKTNNDNSKNIILDIKGEVFDKNKVLKKIKLIYSKYQGNRLVDLIIHGSYADNTYTSFSDIDDIVFVKRGIYNDYADFLKTIKLLKKLNLFYQRNDFTQHHGHWIFSYRDKNDYDNSIMPISVYQDSVSIGGDVKLVLCIKDVQEDFKKIASNIVQEIQQELHKIKNNNVNLYELKNFVSGISLITPLLFQVNNKMLSKKDAISNAHHMLKNKTIRAIKWATKIRKNWSQLKHYSLQKNVFLILSYLFYNRNLLDFFSRKFPLRLRKQDIIFFDKNVEKAIEDLINYSKTCLK